MLKVTRAMRATSHRCVHGKLLSMGLAASQAKLVESRAAAALEAVAVREAKQRCTALNGALAAAELEAESSVSGAN